MKRKSPASVRPGFFVASIAFHRRIRDVVERNLHRGGPQRTVGAAEIDSVLAVARIEPVDRGIEAIANLGIIEQRPRSIGLLVKVEQGDADYQGAAFASAG